MTSYLGKPSIPGIVVYRVYIFLFGFDGKRRRVDQWKNP